MIYRIIKKVNRTHHLAMIVGSCPGVGKSAITPLLAEQLTAQGVPTQPLLEDALSHLDVLAPIRRVFQRENPDKIAILLTVAEALTEDCVRLSKVHSIDAFLSGYHFLLGLYRYGGISDGTQAIYR
jgi:Mrp family chromosome partitioning ATPase